MIALDNRENFRKNYKTNIKVNSSDEKEYHNAIMVNNSFNGMYFTSDKPIKIDSKIQIKINHEPNKTTKTYQAKVKWCNKIETDNDNNYCYGIGVKYTNKNNSVYGLKHFCDLCGEKISLEHITKTDKWTNTCEHCHEKYTAIPSGNIKTSIKKFMDGNIF